MKKFNRMVSVILTVVLTAVFISACKSADSKETMNNKIKVTATIFPEYDFLRQIGGDHIDLKLLLKPGAESHTFEPTPQDIKDIKNSDVFVYVGGDSDEWIDDVLSSIDKDRTHVISLMDCVDTVEEKSVEGMMPDEDDAGSGTPEYDEHVWTSPKNAEIIVKKLCNELCSADASNASDYKTASDAYIEKLESLDKEFRKVVDNSKRKEIIVGDRFPFRYFADEYGLTYYAAFPGCSADTEANAETMAFLVKKVKADSIPVVFHIELSNCQVCDSICEQTGAKSELLNAVHNISADDFKAGVTYIDLMEHNVDVLKEALN